MDGVSEAVDPMDQMGAIIENQIQNNNYDHVVEELGVMEDKLMA